MTAKVDQLLIAAYLRSLHSADDAQSVRDAIVAGSRELLQAKATVVQIDCAGGQFVCATESGNKVQLDSAVVEAIVSCPNDAFRPRPVADSQLGDLVDDPTGAQFFVLLHHDAQALAILLLATDELTALNAASVPLWPLFCEQAALALHHQKKIDLLQREVRDLSAFVSIDEALARTPNFESALGQIIDRVKELVDAEAGGLMLYDPESDHLALQKPALGYSDEVIRSYRVPAGGDESSATSLVFRSGQPYLSNELASDPVIHPGFVRAPGARNIMSVPLDVDGRRIGVFHVVNKRGGDFGESDLRLLNLLASHLGILIHNARLLENERRAVAKLQEANEVIGRQREGLERTLAIHDGLTRMVLAGEGPSAIVATLSRLVDNAVSLEDRFGNPLARFPLPDPELPHQSGGLSQVGGQTKALREDPAIRAILTKLGQERRAMRVPPIPSAGADHPQVVAPVVVGRETMGFLYVAETKRALDEVDLMAVERAALAIALSMMKEKTATEARYKLRGDFVIELVDGNYGPDEMLLSRAVYLGIDLKVARSVLVIDVDDFAGFARHHGGEAKILAFKQRLFEVVERVCHKAGPDTVVSAKSDEIIVLAKDTPARASARRADLRKLGDQLRAEVRRSLGEVSVSVGIGGACETLADYARSYQQARRALDAIKAARQSDRTLAGDDLGVYGVIFDPHNRDRLSTLVDDSIGSLLQYDRQHSGGLTESLEQYLLNDGHLERTAAALGIHLSTLRYRLLRIEQITGADLHSVETKFNLQLALKVWRTTSSGA